VSPPALLLAALCAAAPATLRVDWFHAGDGSRQLFTLDAQVREPLPLAGNPSRPVDDSGLGGWHFEVRGATDDALLYSRGFATLFSEWVTTEEAKRRPRTFHESARFPDPGRPHRLVLRERLPAGNWVARWEVALDPSSPEARTALPPPPARPIPLLRGGMGEAARAKRTTPALAVAASRAGVATNPSLWGFQQQPAPQPACPGRNNVPHPRPRRVRGGGRGPAVRSCDQPRPGLAPGHPPPPRPRAHPTAPGEPLAGRPARLPAPRDPRHPAPTFLG